MNKSIYLILPGCDDTNRGDQALIWETAEIAKAAGYDGEYYMLSDEEHSRQSAEKGIKNIAYILEHPSTHFRDKKNVKYTKILKIKWSLKAICDFLRLEPLVHPFLRKYISKLYNKKTKKTLELFEHAESAFVKGGGFLHAYGGLTDTYKIYFFLYHIRLALSYGMDVYVMPNSFGPFKAPFVKKMIHNTLKKCKVVMTREQISHDVLKEQCNINSYMFTDIAFHLNLDEAFDAKKMLIEKGVPLGKKKCISITMRPYRFDGEEQAEEKYKKYKKSLADFVVWLCQNGFYPVMIEHVFSEQEHENDMSCINDVVHMLPDDLVFSIFSERSLNAEQMKNVYSCFDYIVGTRFHSVIFSLASEVPAIAISYGGNKGTGIMNDLGLSEFCIPISEITSKLLIDTFEKLVCQREHVIARIHQELFTIRKQKENIIELIKDV